MKKQGGYLLIIAVIAIVIIGFIGTIAATMYTEAARSTSNSYQSKEAFYIAKSGLEIVRRDLLQTGSALTCANINNATKYTNACYPPGATNCTGYFNVTSSANTITTTLASAISSTSPTVILNSTAGLLSSGVIAIDNEAIWYNGINGAQLLNVMRGAFNTTAATHTSSTITTQNTCLLTSTGSVPTIANPGGQRVIQELLWKNKNGSGGVGILPNGMSPGLVAAGSISITGNSSVENPNITSLSDPNILGSTIVSGGPVVLNGNAHTSIANNIIASDRSHIGPDIDQNDNRINLGTLWGYFFTQSKTALKNSLPPSSIINDCSTYNFSTASGTLWLNCNNFNPGGNIVIGSNANPVTLIVDNNINMGGNAIINGFLYVTGCLSVGGNSQVNGLTVVEGAINLNGNHDTNFNSQILSILGLINSASYNNYYVAKELFN